MSLFQSTHPHGVRRLEATMQKHGIMFQSTHPHGVRRWTGIFKLIHIKFQSTHPHGVRQLSWGVSAIKPGFNPRTRTGCDWRGIKASIETDVSIHAPARGATGRYDYSRAQIQVSIHAPARGATCLPLRHHWAVNVSIHAPARGATRRWGLCTGRTAVSIHAPARGATLLQVYHCLYKRFQSTHPHGVRPSK